MNYAFNDITSTIEDVAHNLGQEFTFLLKGTQLPFKALSFLVRLLFATKIDLHIEPEVIMDALIPTELIFNPEDGLSAQRLGGPLGLTAQQTNLKLRELGYLEGEPGNWTVTSKGEGRCTYASGENNGHGYMYLIWDPSIQYELGDPEAYAARMNKIKEELDSKYPYLG